MNEEQVPQEQHPPHAHHTAHEMLQDPEFKKLARRKNAMSMTMTVIMMTVYFGFIFLMAFAPDVLRSHAMNATLGIPIGIGVILFAWVLTGIYVRWANTEYDDMVARVKERL